MVVMIGVSDTGRGMPADVVAKAVDPFFTTKPVGEGTGLGLSMIYDPRSSSHLQ
jgi:signal transduction histidine kinase